ncbi:pectinesterase family protein [Mucilaginibacter terrae]|uniref:Pectinesterase n=1 Tax=Mucilaginibacter terrae TaxID=1955052 RepID=A0ABU3GXL8_9SPHI|nr:pectinesterase family protein [Mucilaginibacter terrae]MDT3404521.1 pectinesterase [Mucilaginibacter terrae]
MKVLKLLVLALLTVGNAFAQQPILPNELTVAPDGSGNYKTIQEAVNSVRDLGQMRVVIHIKKGIYHEKLVVPSWKTNISLVGESAESTIITNNDYSGKAVPGGKDSYGKDKMTTYTSYTVLVQGDGFEASNLTIENTAGRVGQAVALHVEADRCVISKCRLLGNQDTLYTATGSSRQLYQDCYIEGTTDFIFGEATVLFLRCTIKNLTDSFITAAATTPNQEFGYVLMDCKLIADSTVKKAVLGRPWRPYAKTVFIHTEIGAHIAPAGWNPWKGDAMFPDKEKTTYYAEYKCYGVGAKTTERVAWSKQLSDKEAKRYTLKNILGGKDNWQPGGN